MRSLSNTACHNLLALEAPTFFFFFFPSKPTCIMVLASLCILGDSADDPLLGGLTSAVVSTPMPDCLDARELPKQISAKSRYNVANSQLFVSLLSCY